ncbi:DUF1549 domain-containing protein [Haloferula sp.]|uniref:DUF1549 domain-containing protein n=1 Tax=Haloferula sp. TaxID=2497595 RepID=UPI00329D2A16
MKLKTSTFIASVLALAISPLGAAESANKADSPEFVRQAALKIDTYVAGWYRQKKLPVPEVTDDATFLRRAFLVGIGRIPTTEEGMFFLEIDDENKRFDLINYLTNSEGYSSHMTNWMFDLLRIKDEMARATTGRNPYRDWVGDKVAKNMKWDEMTNQLLTSKGSLWGEGQAAVGYYLRDQGMPLDNLSNSMQIFLGTQMECAQCHDDPFGDTERHDFYELAAFTEGQSPVPMLRKIGPLIEEARLEKNRGKAKSDIVEMVRYQILEQTLFGGGTGRISLPKDYQYRDGQPGEMIGGRTPFGKTVRMSDRGSGGDGREKLAEWVTAKTDGQFPAVMANRLWHRIMGRGVYEPISEYVEAKDTNMPGLMHYLTTLMVEVDYDLRAFQRILLNTKTFQFVPNPNPPKVQNGDDFHGRQLTRLSAEQIWDSLITLAGGNPDAKPKRTLDDEVRIGRNGRGGAVPGMTMADLSSDVLKLKTVKEVDDYIDGLVAKMGTDGKRKRSGSDSMMMTKEIRNYGKGAQVRSSELPSPAPKDHILFLFGQSARDTVNGANSEPNVSQVLTLMNGFVQDQLVNNPSAHIYKSLKDASSPTEKVRRLYVGILNRPPSEEEMSWMMDEVKISGDTDDAYRNILSALVMSSEFLFLQ